MKVSIIIPVYNNEKFIEESLQSALNQTYSNIEIIAVDDGSQDSSLSILKKYSNQIKIISKKNGGPASSWNTGIKSSTGEWIKLLAGDDVLLPNSIELLMNYIEKHSNESLHSVYYGHYTIIDEKGKKKFDFIERNNNKLTNFERNVILLDHHFGFGGTCIFHKSIFEKFGFFDEKSGFIEDYEMWLRLCLIHNINFHLVPEIIAKYRTHPAQITQSKKKLQEKQSKEIRKKILEQLDNNLQLQYENALLDFKRKKYSLKAKILIQIRNIILKFLPKSVSAKILNSLRNSNIAYKIYHQEMDSWNNDFKNE